ncbi:MAG: glutamine--fructose-6-phosphate aminotransferase, partial [Dermabacter sp.]|nr:glutamine--fructose-6-phosphate aminotransferase [Dermabacter sp.]
MCGIVGYVGPAGAGTSSRPSEVVLGGLSRLEYRGYDSAGIARCGETGIELFKASGKIQNLRDKLEGHESSKARAAIGHTRWATHGGPSDTNAHPHLGGKNGEVALVHNGIIENFAALKKELADDGYAFLSDTDSEVVAHLLARECETAESLTEAMRACVAHLEGAF